MFPNSRTLSAGVHVVSPSDSIIECDTTNGAVELLLPSVEAVVGFISRQGGSVGGLGQFPLTIVDSLGNASVNNIVITPSSGNKFSGTSWVITFPTIVISDNGGSAKIYPIADNVWGVILSGLGGANPVVAPNKSLIMNLSQLGGGLLPTAKIFKNDFGSAPVFTYTGAGVYKGTIVDAFPVLDNFFVTQKQLGKATDIGGGKLSGSFVEIIVLSKDEFQITTFREGLVPSDNLLNKHGVIISQFS